MADMRTVAAAFLIASLASPALAQSAGSGIDTRAGDATVAPNDPADRYGNNSGSYTDLGRVRAHTAQLGTVSPFTATIGSSIGGTIGTTIGPR